MASRRIATTTSDGIVALGSAGQRSHDLLRDVLRTELSERHAALIAEPVPSADGTRIDWYADGGPSRHLLDLPEAEQAAALAELGRLRDDIEALAQRMAERGGASDGQLAAALHQLLEVPDQESVHVLPGEPLQPVLVNWAHRRDEQGQVKSVLATMVRPLHPQLPPPPEPAVTEARRRILFPWWLLWWSGWLLLALLVAWVLWLLILPCGVRLPFGGAVGFCPAPVFAEADGAAARRALLESDIRASELRLAMLEGQCLPKPEEVAAVPEPEPEESDEIEERLDREDAQQGELSFALAWDSRSDVDLFVTCPAGRKIGYDNLSVNLPGCDGNLDVDANGPGERLRRDPVENIYFTEADNGEYLILVDLHAARDGASRERFTVLVRDGGETRQLTGSVSTSNRAWTHVYRRR